MKLEDLKKKMKKDPAKIGEVIDAATEEIDDDGVEEIEVPEEFAELFDAFDSVSEDSKPDKKIIGVLKKCSVREILKAVKKKGPTKAVKFDLKKAKSKIKSGSKGIKKFVSKSDLDDDDDEIELDEESFYDDQFDLMEEDIGTLFLGGGLLSAFSGCYMLALAIDCFMLYVVLIAAWTGNVDILEDEKHPSTVGSTILSFLLFLGSSFCWTVIAYVKLVRKGLIPLRVYVKASASASVKNESADLFYEYAVDDLRNGSIKNDLKDLIKELENSADPILRRADNIYKKMDELGRLLDKIHETHPDIEDDFNKLGQEYRMYCNDLFRNYSSYLKRYKEMISDCNEFIDRIEKMNSLPQVSEKDVKYIELQISSVQNMALHYVQNEAKYIGGMNRVYREIKDKLREIKKDSASPSDIIDDIKNTVVPEKPEFGSMKKSLGKLQYAFAAAGIGLTAATGIYAYKKYKKKKALKNKKEAESKETDKIEETSESVEDGSILDMFEEKENSAKGEGWLKRNAGKVGFATAAVGVLMMAAASIAGQHKKAVLREKIAEAIQAGDKKCEEKGLNKEYVECKSTTRRKEIEEEIIELYRQECAARGLEKVWAKSDINFMRNALAVYRQQLEMDELEQESDKKKEEIRKSAEEAGFEGAEFDDWFNETFDQNHKPDHNGDLVSAYRMVLNDLYSRVGKNSEPVRN